MLLTHWHTKHFHEQRSFSSIILCAATYPQEVEHGDVSLLPEHRDECSPSSSVDLLQTNLLSPFLALLSQLFYEVTKLPSVLALNYYSLSIHLQEWRTFVDTRGVSLQIKHIFLQLGLERKGRHEWAGVLVKGWALASSPAFFSCVASTDTPQKGH